MNLQVVNDLFKSSQRFAQSSVLNTHMRLHTGRPEVCKICEQRFCRPAELRLHMRKHTGMKGSKFNVPQLSASNLRLKILFPVKIYQHHSSTNSEIFLLLIIFLFTLLFYLSICPMHFWHEHTTIISCLSYILLHLTIHSFSIWSLHLVSCPFWQLHFTSCPMFRLSW